IAEHRAWQEARLTENLKPVADAEDGTAGSGEIGDGRHDRREPRDRAGSQIIPVGKASWQHDHVRTLQRGFLVPDELGLLAEHMLRRVIGIVIAVRTGKDDDAEFHSAPRFQLPATSSSHKRLEAGGWKLLDLHPITLDH